MSAPIWTCRSSCNRPWQKISWIRFWSHWKCKSSIGLAAPNLAVSCEHTLRAEIGVYDVENPKLHSVGLCGPLYVVAACTQSLRFSRHFGAHGDLDNRLIRLTGILPCPLRYKKEDTPRPRQWWSFTIIDFPTLSRNGIMAIFGSRI